MYSRRIIERNIEQTEANLGIKLKRYDPGFCAEAREHLDSLRKQDGSLKRPLSQAEEAFIKNEGLMSKCDFEYWANRYCTTQLDGFMGGGLGPLNLWGSQRVIHSFIAKAEEEEWAKRDADEPCDGILAHFDKARQLGLTLMARALTMHRVLFYDNIRGLAASVDDDKIKELYDRDKRIYNTGLEKEEYTSRGGVPWWMRPVLTYDVKSAHMNFGLSGSSILYQFSTMGSGIGQSRQFDIGHCTEIAYWTPQATYSLDQDFFPTLPQSPSTMCLLESVSFGRSGWWYEHSVNASSGKLARWRYCFVPWYSEPGKYRRKPPESWVPDPLAERHAEMVWETSHGFIGERVRLTREQLYWWWTTREEHREADTLAVFFQNYSATPEESFQHSAPTAISIQTLDWLRTEANSIQPVPYVLRLNGTYSKEDDWTNGKVPIYKVGKDAAVPAHPNELDKDARGIVWIWEAPKLRANYVMGIDPTHGIMPWTRSERTTNDYRIDNGCIQIVRCASEEGAQDVQVCEYAAPVDQESLGEVANLLGRIFGGGNEDGQALCITEIHLALGLAVQRTLMDSGYTNLWAWEHIEKFSVAKTASLGWYASPTAVRTLWEKFRRIVTLRTLKVKSRWLVEELADCIWDDGKKTANAAPGKHDDRIRAIALCEWAGHSWSQSPETITTEDVDRKDIKVLDYQKTAMTYEQVVSAMNESVETWLD